MTKQTQTKKMAIAAKKASLFASKSSIEQRNKALKILIKHLKSHSDAILQANQLDISQAKANGLNTPLLERLSMEGRLQGIIQEIEQVILLPDPIGTLFDEQILPNQLKLAKHHVPIGVLGIIYESRPNVTLDVSALTIKSGNCAILRGGTEALHTNQLFVRLIQESLADSELPVEAIQLMTNPDRKLIKELLQMHAHIDLIIPRGSAALQQFCLQHSKIPVITGGIGICHLFVDVTADIERSLQVILNAKTQRPTVCNALDTLLVHKQIAAQFLPKMVEELSKKGVTFRLDDMSWNLLKKTSCCQRAEEKDWDTEWLSLILGVKVVEGLEEAITHIQRHSSGHSDGILTENSAHAECFIKEIDSAAVYVNASTRFTDGGQFGLGSEVAISTQKLHARGPMGLRELTTYKWIINGNYQVRT